ncbi:MAG: hypothetical protein NC548_61810 [Lachnospiraceae bacterium]|nr:hypothetical protein [Lachnospiraceae bacterium]
MDNSFKDTERLYRAVYPPSHPGMFWKENGQLSSSAFADPHGLSVERGDYREPNEIIQKMKESFIGCIVSLSVGDCRATDAVVKYAPTKNNDYHSEIHGSETTILLNKKQRFQLAKAAKVEYMEE